MKTYTYGKTPKEVIMNRLPHKYPMELNKTDMFRLLVILGQTYDEWAINMRQAILETIGIEEV